ncbi:glucosyltransferase domain-containing protein [Pantoea endophytica]|uniref:glucosyltransferase domain-containing protein n=1 Tax=Pantoea endophytica TaxID=92488 RepID=UPI003019B77B
MTNIACNNFKVYLFLAAALLVCYSPVFLSSYAFSDDWYYLFSAQTDPASILKWDVLSGRPAYGALRYVFSFLISSLNSLILIRVLSVASLILLSCYFYKFISERDILKNPLQRVIFSLVICLLPSFQVFNAWSVCFPFVTSILLAGWSYSALTRLRGIKGVTVSALLITLSFAIYQPTAMCFLFFAFMDTCLTPRKVAKKELIRTFLIIFFGMLMALILAKVIPLLLFGETLSRSNITLDLMGKIKWFFVEPLKNAICNFDTGRKALSVIVSLLFIFIGLKKISGNGKEKVILSLLFAVAAVTPNLLVTESWAAYRTISALSLITTSCFLIGLFVMIDKTKYSRFLYLLLPVAAGWLAANNIKEGFSSPQQKEYALLKDEITKVVAKDFDGALYYRLNSENLPKIAKSSKYDEFGSLSLGMSWTFAGMAFTVKKEAGMHYTLTKSPVINGNESCSGKCIIIDAQAVLARQ